MSHEARLDDDPRASIRRFAGRALVGGLSVAAFTAVVALLLGNFDETEARVILTSIGFALASSTGAAGAAQRVRAAGWLRTLGTATAALSAISFALLVPGLWTGDWGSEGIWRAFGCAALLAIAGAHACLVLGARRRSDRDLVRLLVNASLALALLDTLGALLPIAGLVDDVDEGAAKLLAAALVLLVLTTVLPPILRRMQPATPGRAQAAGSSRAQAGSVGSAQAGAIGQTPPGVAPAGPAGGAREDALTFLAEEVESIAIRIEDLSRGTAIRTPEIRREAERLRDLARSFQS